MLRSHDGIWMSTDSWKIPNENSTGLIENLNTSMILGVLNGSTVDTVNKSDNIEQYWKQMWKRGKTNVEGYYNFTHAASLKLLTANSSDTLKIEGL